MGKSSSKNTGKIVCFHLFNDFSGSPTVLKGILQGLLNKGESIDLVTSRGGVLDKLEHEGLKRLKFDYSFTKNFLATALRFFYAQTVMMIAASRYIFNRKSIFYINTILPVGPAMIGKLIGKKVIYHYHENAYVKSGLYRILAKMMEKLANEIICVSSYQASFLKRSKNVTVVPNSLEEEFLCKIKPNPQSAFERRNILLISSLKEYKGVKEFLKLSEFLNEYKFTLVLNANGNEILQWVKDNKIKVSDNCKIYPRTDDVAFFYNNASLLLNLSNSDFVVETFGMTVLEAMSAGLPVIVPPVGGVAEMVEEGVTGFKISSKDLLSISSKIKDIFSNKDKYIKLSQNALSLSKNYNGETAIISILNIIKKADRQEPKWKSKDNTLI